MLNSDTLLWSAGITALIFVLRAVHFADNRIACFSINLFCPTRTHHDLIISFNSGRIHDPLINTALIIQVILMTAVVMMLGLMSQSNLRK